ncbi:hypothetical protein BELL_0264g00060 [Botrytis elliptica]|uniref:Myb-like domain-containing protein n=1 Tax=Botrytis elliptica TaxID=278938 RepID=A0A4Z1JLW6_9HELO|nr:hypothetical protein EAE99_005801 [Botrytis elliptica]TGO74665.1 hypothetical protein BELL_0264g00060 [Botrytis elliptica]
MRTTIEPHLMSILNNDASEAITNSPSLELPPLHDRNILQTSHRPLVLEPNAGTGSGEPSSQVSQHSSSIAPLDDNEVNYRDSEEGLRIGNAGIGKDISAIERTLGSSSPQSLRKILDDNTGNARPLHPKKQQHRENGSDEFVQLPRPPKKQRSNKQVVPPIIIGLHEPPPQAALFPPIASSSFHDSHGRNTLNALAPKVTEMKEDLKTDGVIVATTQEVLGQKASTKKKRKDVKTRKRWSEDETNNLLLGVDKYGVGKWMDILEDPKFTFNNRSGVDLKDRFRTCCPEELRAGSRKSGNYHTGTKAESAKAQSKTELVTFDPLTGNFMTGEDQETDETLSNSGSNPGRKPRNHRRNLTSLQELGIKAPFKQSDRRKKRPFSNQDDREIREGYNIYGPAWTRIQRDPQFNLQDRQPTDLRDRLRNKHPELFRSGEDDTTRTASQSQSKPTQVEDLSNTSNHATIDSTTFALNHETLKPTAEPTDSLSFSQSFDWPPPPFPYIGEMDISRLLEDQNQWTP